MGLGRSKPQKHASKKETEPVQDGVQQVESGAMGSSADNDPVQCLEQGDPGESAEQSNRTTLDETSNTKKALPQLEEAIGQGEPSGDTGEGSFKEETEVQPQPEEQMETIISNLQKQLKEAGMRNAKMKSMIDESITATGELSDTIETWKQIALKEREEKMKLLKEREEHMKLLKEREEDTKVLNMKLLKVREENMELKQELEVFWEEEETRKEEKKRWWRF